MRASGYKYEDNGFYQEPSWFADAIFEVEDMRAGVYDPFCGEGTIPKAALARGIQAIGSDIVDRGYGVGGTDFFSVGSRFMPIVCNIVTNPDYSILREAIDHALSITIGKVAVVARLGFLASQARREWFQSVPLARVWIASKRPSMPPGGKGIKASGGTIEYCWLVFDRLHVGETVIRWLPITPSATAVFRVVGDACRAGAPHDERSSSTCTEGVKTLGDLFGGA
jgi:hypothetical protein